MDSELIFHIRNTIILTSSFTEVDNLSTLWTAVKVNASPRGIYMCAW